MKEENLLATKDLPGTVVRIHGLQSRADLNGRLSNVICKLETGRFQVEIGATSEKEFLALKKENLLPAE